MFSAASWRCHAISAPTLFFLVPALGPVKLLTLHYVHPIVRVSVCNNDRGRCNAQLFQTMFIRCVHRAILVVQWTTKMLYRGSRPRSPSPLLLYFLSYIFFSLPLSSLPLFIGYSIIVPIIVLLDAFILPLNTHTVYIGFLWPFYW